MTVEVTRLPSGLTVVTDAMPHLQTASIGVWVGFDTKRPIGQGQSGSVAALPIWIDVMKHWVDRQRKAGKGVPEFPAPGNIVFTTNAAGQREAFIAGTEPGAEIR